MSDRDRRPRKRDGIEDLSQETVERRILGLGAQGALDPDAPREDDHPTEDEAVAPVGAEAVDEGSPEAPVAPVRTSRTRGRTRRVSRVAPEPANPAGITRRQLLSRDTATLVIGGLLMLLIGNFVVGPGGIIGPTIGPDSSQIGLIETSVPIPGVSQGNIITIGPIVPPTLGLEATPTLIPAITTAPYVAPTPRITPGPKPTPRPTPGPGGTPLPAQPYAACTNDLLDPLRVNCVNQSVDFTAGTQVWSNDGSGSVVGGAASGSDTYDVAFPIAGAYTVTIQVTGANGVPMSYVVGVAVAGATPVPTVPVSTQAPVAGVSCVINSSNTLQVDCSDTSIGEQGGSQVWSAGGAGSIISGGNGTAGFSFAYSSAGNYTVSLQITGYDGITTNTATTGVSPFVTPPPPTPAPSIGAVSCTQNGTALDCSDTASNIQAGSQVWTNNGSLPLLSGGDGTNAVSYDLTNVTTGTVVRVTFQVTGTDGTTKISDFYDFTMP